MTFQVDGACSWTSDRGDLLAGSNCNDARTFEGNRLDVGAIGMPVNT